ncbi:MAG: hypothetical protein LBT75_05610 [Bacilli bacterium]|jgi:conjugal transfer/entry exclusion protein|nr:hypothetical protein [Bacilli bacterium]
MNSFLENSSFFLIYICLPVAGIITLIYIIILLNQMINTVKGTNKLVDDVQNKLDSLQGIIDTIMGIHNKYVGVMGVFSSLASKTSKIKRKKNKKEEDD